MNYDVDYFIEKFESIPDELWCTHNYTDGARHCVLGHCGAPDFVQEAVDLDILCGFYASQINDGRDYRYQQPTPKARVLAALRDINVANCSQ